MNFQNYMKIEFLSKSQNESFARVVVASFVSQLDPTIEELADIKTAVSEAVTNAIIHGYDNSNEKIVIECKINGNNIEIIIEDFGNGIEDIELARQPLYTSKPELERSGMGFTVMETFMDEVFIKSEKNKGTKIEMRKRIRIRAKENEE
ncbi:stage II sporulation protein AB (anti-sigma F factor) [Paramaledivibacter caminithermalis DSM 15212]|uniref:Anti-sigma F factor n=2 Tax=Paramaledivibacter TaxID=1884934 RepID=A0A1M6Q1U4_PARC5|nr:anti-sigma F factor [Paramaledivibacter caminithermalis]SHK14153.1 stage II sporulation protein AB (anti-sigma F factor) [Paramaledivibacter caminithermalis DSM 15212]